MHGYSSMVQCVQKLTPISEGVLQNVTNKTFLVYVKSKKFAFSVTLRPLGFMNQGKAELCTSKYKGG